MEKQIKKNINEIRNITSKMPRNISEAMNCILKENFGFEGEVTEGEEFGDEQLKKRPMGMAPQMQGNVPQEDPEVMTPEAQGEAMPTEGGMDAAPIGGDMGEVADKDEIPQSEGESFNVEQFVDDIRKKSLKGMAALADNPDDERYQLLKKIWQICDKKPEQQTAFNNPGAAKQMVAPAPKKF